MKNQKIKDYLQSKNFKQLFIDLGWDNVYSIAEDTVVEDSILKPQRVAQKKGLVVWQVDCINDIPQSSERRRLVLAVKKISRDALIVFTSSSSKQHLWLWPEQQPSGHYKLAKYEYSIELIPEAFLQRLNKISFAIEEEPGLTAIKILERVRDVFDADKVTNIFYKEFTKHHKSLAQNINGIDDLKEKNWYASILLNRLMFIYFIQNKNFLDNDKNYLRNRLKQVRHYFGDNHFFAFFKQFLLPLFHQGLGKRKPQYDDTNIQKIIGKVPYINGGIFQIHELEEGNDINIKDEEFDKIFKFFDQYRWHLDESPLSEERSKEINPDILGFIFERYINYTEKGQKDSGAYYTKPDITGYMAEFTILPKIADKLIEAGLDCPSVLLKKSGDTYIHDSIRYGVDEYLKLNYESKQDSELGNPPESIGHKGERWCDIQYRVKRCQKLRYILNNEKQSLNINDAITENLNLSDLFADYCSLLSLDECKSVYKIISSLTICDPTVGSGAFLFAAIEVLQPLYENVISRVSELCNRNNYEKPEFLREEENHPNRSYWIIKTICLRNLYGVDIMKGAIEIARLRLFLKLAAQIDNFDDIEPLPDLDFNIKEGNMLVGVIDKKDVFKRFGEGLLIKEKEVDNIQLLANSAAHNYRQFIDMQTMNRGGIYITKKNLMDKLDTIRNESNKLLHLLRKESMSLSDWLLSHRPFHWFVEFPSVWQKGGFDAIIGNPPYINIKNNLKYIRKRYQTLGCPDLYASCLERASALLNIGGRFSMIVMHSMCYSENYKALRRYIENNFDKIWISSYDRCPSFLFNPKIKVRNSILLAISSLNENTERERERESFIHPCAIVG